MVGPLVGLNVPFYARYRSFWRQFYGSDDPINSITALKNSGWSSRSGANPQGSAY